MPPPFHQKIREMPSLLVDSWLFRPEARFRLKPNLPLLSIIQNPNLAVSLPTPPYGPRPVTKTQARPNPSAGQETSSPVSPYLIALFSVILFSTSSYATPPISNITHESILQCLLHHSIPHNLLYTESTTSYTTLLQSSIQNQRFNTPTTPKPFLIVSPTLESHVQATVKCSHNHGLQIRVWSGGHDYEALSYVSHDPPFIVLDLHSLSSISTDTSHGTAWVQAGATIGELYYRIAEENKTAGFPAGLCLTLGIGGHLSGGGLGTMLRMYGLAADNIIDARLVNAKGEDPG